MQQADHPDFVEKTQTLNTMLHQILNQALVAVSADAGSLMLVDHKLGILQIKARLGRPRPNRLMEPVFKLNAKSAAAWAVHNRQSYVCGDVETDGNVQPPRADVNFSSLLVVPVIHGDSVIAVLNADAREKEFFNDEHRKKLEQLASRVAPTIAERINALDAVAELAFSLSRLPELGGVKPVLDRIAELAVRSLGADTVTLYQYVQQRSEFTVPDTPLTMAGDFRDERAMREKVHPGDVPWTVVKERRSGFYPNVRDVGFLAGDLATIATRKRPRFVDREEIESMAALLLPSRAAEHKDEEVVGVMFVNYRRHHDFNIDEVAALATFADYAAVAILNARREEQRRAEQMRMVETMLANFAHRMGNLAGTAGVARQILSKRIRPDDEAAQHQLDLLERKSHALLELADRLVRPFKKTGRIFELAPLDLAATVAAGLEDLKPNLDRLEVQRDIPASLPQVHSVQFQLEQVIHDLVNNAVEAMAGRAGGRLTIRASHDLASHRVRLEIGDNGPGIGDEIVGRLFSPGVSTKRGLGIGLWWSQTFMRATGGDLSLTETSPRGGASFLVSIPCVPQGPSVPRLARGGRQQVDVLIVDDDTDWAESIAALVKEEGWSAVITASQANAATALATTRFSVAVLDVRLVDADPANKGGLELLEKIDADGLDTRVLLMSGYWDDSDIARARRSPRLVETFVKQRFDMRTFIDAVRQGLDHGNSSSGGDAETRRDAPNA